jgi:RNA polymerase sigma-70 factor (ECF subfamily)
MAEIPLTRASLLVRLRDPRDEAAWTQFVHLYAPLVYSYARKQGLQDADAADLSQDVLSTVAASIGRLEYDAGRGSFRCWLFTIVRRRLSNWRRARKARPAGRYDSASQRSLEQRPTPDGPEEEWEAEWQQQVFAWACAQVRQDVTDLTWQAFWRTAMGGQPGKLVAAELDLTIAAVYHARSRVFARLKELVQSVQEP